MVRLTWINNALVGALAGILHSQNLISLVHCTQSATNMVFPCVGKEGTREESIGDLSKKGLSNTVASSVGRLYCLTVEVENYSLCDLEVITHVTVLTGISSL